MQLCSLGDAGCSVGGNGDTQRLAVSMLPRKGKAEVSEASATL